MKKQFCCLRPVQMMGRTSLLVLFLLGLSASSYAATTTTESIDKCEDEALQTGLVQNAQAYAMLLMQAQQEVVKADLVQFEANPMQYHRDVRDSMCIARLLKKQKDIAKKASLESIFSSFVDDLLSDLEEQLCSYVESNIKTAVSNALNLLCIPVPDLGYFTLSLPSLEKTACNGVSLASYMGYTTVSGGSFSSRVPETYLDAPLLRSGIDFKSSSDDASVSTTGW
ncbi:MAG: hypothetical protein PHD48_08770 [Alphaproteobacteria bacterium]|nr:hypothetical protein [Alphaproteobacteria bacterium]